MPSSETADRLRGEASDPTRVTHHTAEPAASGEATLRTALRRARIDEAERARAIGDIHAVEVARLEVLRDRLEPLVAALPADATLFDFAVVPSPRPRLFVDMIGFVEMAADRRRYRLVQDTRDGRFVLHEAEGLDAATAAVTAYVARRLIEREKMLAAAGGPLPGSLPRAPWLAEAGRIVLEYLGVAALVVLFWVLGHVLFQWAVTR